VKFVLFTLSGLKVKEGGFCPKVLRATFKLLGLRAGPKDKTTPKSTLIQSFYTFKICSFGG